MTKWAIILAALAAGCSTSTPKGAGGSAADGGGGAGGEGGGGAGGTGVVEYDGSVSGTVHDDQGSPIEGLDIALCATVCRIAQTDANGTVVFEGVEPASHVFEPLSFPTDDQPSAAHVYSKFFDFAILGEDEQLVFERPVVMRQIATTGPLSGAQDLMLDGGLRVAFSADGFSVMDESIPFPATEVHFGAVELPEADWPRSGYEGWTILRAWNLAVWDLYREDAFTVSAPLTTPLPQGSEVAFLVADYTYGFLNGVFFEEAATLSADGMTISSTAGIDRSTLWLAVVRQ